MQSSNKPVAVSPKRAMPTLLKIKSGPELFVKARSLSPSSLVTLPSSLKSATILAPTGYPLISPMTKAKPPIPGTLNKGLMNLSSNLPVNSTTLV